MAGLEKRGTGGWRAEAAQIRTSEFFTPCGGRRTWMSWGKWQRAVNAYLQVLGKKKQAHRVGWDWLAARMWKNTLGVFSTRRLGSEICEAMQNAKNR